MVVNLVLVYQFIVNPFYLLLFSLLTLVILKLAFSAFQCMIWVLVTWMRMLFMIDVSWTIDTLCKDSKILSLDFDVFS